MSDDLANQSLGYPPGNKLSLWERRAQYESWLASGRTAPRPIPQLHTGVAHTRIDDVDKGHELKAPEVGTINPLPPGAVVRTDEGGDDANPSDDVRLGLGKMLLKKAEGASPEEATRIANAANAILGPMITRADDDKDLKKTVTGQGPVKKGSSPGAATAKDEDEEEPDKDKAKPRKVPDDDEGNEPTLRELMDALRHRRPKGLCHVAKRITQKAARRKSSSDRLAPGGHCGGAEAAVRRR